jgi:hypothetical protein
VSLGVPKGTKLVIPEQVSAAPVWISDVSDSSVIAVDPTKGQTDHVQVGLDGPTWGAPEAAGAYVYLYEQATGSVVTVDSRTGSVTRKSLFQKGVHVSLFGKDNLTWGNDFAGPRAFVADATGTVKTFYKYLPKAGGLGLFKRVHKPVHRIKHKAKKAKRHPVHHRKLKKPKVKKKPKPKHKAKPKTTSTTRAPTTTTTLPLCTTTTTGSTTTTAPGTTTTTAPCRQPTTTTTAPPTTTTTAPPTTTTTSTTAPSTTTSTASTTTTSTAPSP